MATPISFGAKKIGAKPPPIVFLLALAAMGDVEALRALKRELKTFERSFEQEHGRIATRVDIEAAGMLRKYNEYRHRRGQIPSMDRVSPPPPLARFPTILERRPLSQRQPAAPRSPLPNAAPSSDADMIEGSPVKRVQSIFRPQPVVRTFFVE